MALENCPPNTITFNTFIKGLCGCGREDWAMKVLDQMKQYRCKPNITTYNELLDGLLKVNRLKEAFELVMDIEESGIELNIVSYNTILHGFCHAGMLDEAFKFMGKMLVGGTKPDAITFNILIYAYCRQGKVGDAIQLLDRIRARGEWNPDIISYNSILWGICNWIGLEEAFHFLQKMLNEGFRPNNATWNVLVRCFFSNLGHLGPVYVLDEIMARKSPCWASNRHNHYREGRGTTSSSFNHLIHGKFFSSSMTQQPLCDLCGMVAAGTDSVA
ncbi:hypothetical protein Patl1_24831 [Pistacia atlantica]|uniref:Uncharacterized protein n=1 Tax=Pistacia atlantica TaxID=434234 RepID=A0ACC1B525_9ROSI|nr:hypothetical protein Patl1_24831 [Pistacia atlantica]